jgi:1-acyl-sn-glycerol-3-phosphate acyltransferase
MHWVYYFGRVLIYILLAPFGWVWVRGQHNVPASGPVLVVCNHLNNGDPPLVATKIKLRCVIMAKESLFKHAWSRFWVKNFGAFPVRREGISRQTLESAEAWLRKGVSVIMFPEGHRSPDGTMQPALPGAAVLAARFGVPILPCAITGTEKLNNLKRCLIHRTRVLLTIGKPFRLPVTGARITREERNALTRDIMGHIAALLPPSYRGVYAGDVNAQD